MKTLKIPRGWRKLRKGTVIAKGDAFIYGDRIIDSLRIGEKTRGQAVYIRRIKRK